VEHRQLPLRPGKVIAESTKMIETLPELLHWLLGAPDGRAKMNEIAAAGYYRATSQQARAAMLAPMSTALQGVASGTTRI
jgi:hypothetical protein